MCTARHRATGCNAITISTILTERGSAPAALVSPYIPLTSSGSPSQREAVHELASVSSSVAHLELPNTLEQMASMTLSTRAAA